MEKCQPDHSVISFHGFTYIHTSLAIMLLSLFIAVTDYLIQQEGREDSFWFTVEGDTADHDQVWLAAVTAGVWEMACLCVSRFGSTELRLSLDWRQDWLELKSCPTACCLHESPNTLLPSSGFMTPSNSVTCSIHGRHFRLKLYQIYSWMCICMWETGSGSYVLIYWQVHWKRGKILRTYQSTCQKKKFT